MSARIRIEQFSDKNIDAYERLTKLGDDGKPMLSSVCGRNFMLVIVYADDQPCAWISVGPLTDFYWSWKRVAHIGEIAKTTAGIMCFTVAHEFRRKGLQSQILHELKTYGKEKGWTSIETILFQIRLLQSMVKR